MNILHTQNLTFQYSQEKALYFPDISLDIGNSGLLLGNSGTGKTTFLHLIAGLLTPSAGEVLISGQNIHQLKGEKRDIFRGKQIGIVLQQAHLFPALTVWENLRSARHFAQLPAEDDFCKTLLKKVNLYEKRDKLPESLSVGEQQRVGIVRALSTRPALLLADEPTSALDDENCYAVFDLLASAIQSSPSALLIVTHDIRLKERVEKQFVLNNEIRVPKHE